MRKKAVEIAQTWNKNLTPGAMLEGVYTKNEIYASKFGETHKYIIEKDDNKFAIFSSASLEPQFSNVPVGSYVWVTYKGEETSKSGRPVKVYEVEYDDDYKA